MKTIGRYIIRGVLGRGGMAKVFKVELPAIGKIAALKLFDPDPLLAKIVGAAKLHEYFVREATTMAGLNHPHIVAVHDFDQSGGHPFYVMDFFANNLGVLIGETYHAEHPSRPLPVDKAIDYTRQTLSGLDCLHAAGVVHRDIKPFNLLLTAWDTVKICDFGLSRWRGEGFGAPAHLKVGSPYYAAPEQENHPDTAEARADLYPVGVMLYRMLTGRLPAAVSTAQFEPVCCLNPDLDSRWDDFLARALAVQPQARFASARCMLTELEKLSDHWESEKQMICARPDDRAPEAGTPATMSLRTTPVKVAPVQARDLFGLDPLWRPRTYTANRFETGGATVRDHVTDLIWQKSGRAFACHWREAHAYVERLNRERFANRTTWRLPTIAELNSLITPARTPEALCIAPVFDQTLRWLWSSDRRSYMAAYYADLVLGFVGWQDLSATFHARAVCST
jgi:serine/threonine protein kinase